MLLQSLASIRVVLDGLRQFVPDVFTDTTGLAFTYRSCRVPGDHFRYLRVGKEGIFLDLALAWPAGKYRSRAASALAELFQEMAPELLQR